MLLTQWHREPLHPRGADGAFLHRPATEGADERRGLFVPDGRGVGAAEWSLLCATRGELLGGRSVLWDRVLGSCTALLGALDVSDKSSCKLSELVQLLGAASTFITVGTQFGGGDAHALLGCLRQKSKQFFQGAHCEYVHYSSLLTTSALLSFFFYLLTTSASCTCFPLSLLYLLSWSCRYMEIVRTQLNMEQWRRIPLNIKSLDGLLSLNKKGGRAEGKAGSATAAAAAAAAAAASAAVAAARRPGGGGGGGGKAGQGASSGQSVFEAFATRGNPFRRETAADTARRRCSLLARKASLNDAGSWQALQAGVLGGGMAALAGGGGGGGGGGAGGMGMVGGGGHVQHLALDHGGEEFLGEELDEEELRRQVKEARGAMDDDSDDGEGGENAGEDGGQEGENAAAAENAELLPTPEEAAAAAAAAAHVLTNATWSGVRYAGKYLQMMEQLSHACVESFVGLTHLFDFYLYTTFVVFVPQEAQCVLFGAAARARAAAAARKRAVAAAAAAGAGSGELAELPEADVSGEGSGLLADVHGGLGVGPGRGRLVPPQPHEGSGQLLQTIAKIWGELGRDAPLEKDGGGGDHGGSGGSGGGGGGGGGGGEADASGLASGTAAELAVAADGEGAADDGSAHSAFGMRLGGMGARAFSAERTTFARPLPRTDLPAALEPPNMKRSNMFAVSERAVAVESLAFLLGVLERVRPRMQALLPRAHRPLCTQFFERSAAAVAELRGVCYRAVVPLLCRGLTSLPRDIAAANWDLRELASDCSTYVAVVEAQCTELWFELAALPGIAPPVRLELWGNTLEAMAAHLVEGYSRVRKCSTEGRALMAMDLQALYSALNEVCPETSTVLGGGVGGGGGGGGSGAAGSGDAAAVAAAAAAAAQPPRRGRAFVDEYIRAFYLPTEAEALQWVKEHKVRGGGSTALAARAAPSIPLPDSICALDAARLPVCSHTSPRPPPPCCPPSTARLRATALRVPHHERHRRQAQEKEEQGAGRVGAGDSGGTRLMNFIKSHAAPASSFK